ncbi:MAG: LCP family protein [Clostridium sp.]|jgi:anionic cell wall polymer biosynthesis LytR-Cps2A-Psr (LCP) family protein|nr:LCP family protein [Clostridium sp.]
MKRRGYREQKRNYVKIGVGALALFILLEIALFALRSHTINMIRQGATSKHPTLFDNISQTQALMVQGQEPVVQGQEDVPVIEEGWIVQNNVAYEYRENLLNFLFIICADGVADESNYPSPVQSLVLLTLDPNTKQISALAVDRNAMAHFEVYDPIRETQVEMFGQLASAYAYGSDPQESARYMKFAMSRYLYDLPIHGYVAIDLAAIAQLNDQVGGVTLSVLENDLPAKMPDQGKMVTLQGTQAYEYVTYLNPDAASGSKDRLMRQKQFINAFFLQGKEAFAQDATLPIKILDVLLDDVHTDILANEIAYLAQMTSTYEFREDAYSFVLGYADHSKEYKEFYTNDLALQNMMVELFYQPVEVK